MSCKYGDISKIPAGQRGLEWECDACDGQPDCQVGRVPQFHEEQPAAPAAAPVPPDRLKMLKESQARVKKKRHSREGGNPDLNPSPPAGEGEQAGGSKKPLSQEHLDRLAKGRAELKRKREAGEIKCKKYKPRKKAEQIPASGRAVEEKPELEKIPLSPPLGKGEAEHLNPSPGTGEGQGVGVQRAESAPDHPACFGRWDFELLTCREDCACHHACKVTTPVNLAAPAPDRHELPVCFKKNPDLLKWIFDMAEADDRNPDQEVIALLKYARLTYAGHLELIKNFQEARA